MNIYLTGYRGSGKSTLGRYISPILNYTFIDIDDMIVKAERKSIPLIFSESGEEYFREIESKILMQVSGGSCSVVATGGGIILKKSNRDQMKRTGYCVYLKTVPSVLLSRIEGDMNRPPLTELPLEREIDHILSIREPLYEEISEISIDTGALSIEECAQRVIKGFKNKGGMPC